MPLTKLYRSFISVFRWRARDHGFWIFKQHLIYFILETSITVDVNTNWSERMSGGKSNLPYHLYIDSVHFVNDEVLLQRFCFLNQILMTKANRTM